MILSVENVMRQQIVGGRTLIAGPPESAPFSPDLTVLEEDTHRVLSAAPSIAIHPGVTTEHALARVRADVTPAVGTIARRGPALLAIVHELAADPTCRPEWIASALDAALALVDRERAATLALPPLGTVHGPIPLDQSLGLLRSALEARPAPALERVWLVIRPEQAANVADCLRSW